MPSCHFVHLILLSSGPKVPKSGPFKNEGIHELATYIRQALSKLPDDTPAFGRPIGLIMNYTPARAIKFDLSGRALELLPKGVPPTRQSLTLKNVRSLPPLNSAIVIRARVPRETSTIFF